MKSYVNPSFIWTLSPSLTEDVLATTGTFYCHCEKQEWLSFIELLLETFCPSEDDLQVNELIKGDFFLLKAKIHQDPAILERLKKILQVEGPFSNHLTPSFLINLWHSEFRIFLRILKFAKYPVSGMDFSSPFNAYKINPQSQIYLSFPLGSFQDLHYKYFDTERNVILKPQATFRYYSNIEITSYLIGPVDSVFNADLVGDLNDKELFDFAISIEMIQQFFSNRTLVEKPKGRIEKYLFLHGGKIRIALPPLFDDGFSFENSLEILNQLIMLLPKHRNLIEGFKLKYHDMIGTIIQQENSLDEEGRKWEVLNYFSRLYEGYHGDYIHSIVRELKEARRERLNVVEVKKEEKVNLIACNSQRAM